MGEYDTSTTRDCVDTGGDLDCSDSPVDFNIVQKIVHENYDPFSVNQANDIALLRLDRPVQYTGIYFCLLVLHKSCGVKKCKIWTNLV